MRTTKILTGFLLAAVGTFTVACGGDEGEGGDDSAGGGSSGSGGTSSTGGGSGTSGTAGTGSGTGWQCIEGAAGCQCYDPPLASGMPGGSCATTHTCCVHGLSASSNPSQCFCGGNADRCMVSRNAMTAAGLTVTDVASCPPP